MFQNSVINIVLRVICLLTFAMVVFFTKSFVTIGLLTVVFYLFTRNDNFSFMLWLHIVTIITFLFCYFTNSFLLLKTVLLCGLAIYFLVDPYGNKYTIVNKPKKITLDKYLIRFKKIDLKRKGVLDNSYLNAIYITVHLFILFITIVVG